jgi:hypothetical protein
MALSNPPNSLRISVGIEKAPVAVLRYLINSSAVLGSSPPFSTPTFIKSLLDFPPHIYFPAYFHIRQLLF